ncbi:MAG: phenylalanine--tRNA ligase subunit alpha [Bacilli bacterium]|nr:phenylalanine--tRNA ligase subunit alpha [Bacilli bacterium]
MDNNTQINKIREQFMETIDKVISLEELKEIRITYLGKKGAIQKLTAIIKDLPIDEKKVFGKNLNELKDYINSKINMVESALENNRINQKLSKTSIDVTLPGIKLTNACVHPLTKVVNDIENLFVSMGYDVVLGPEIESDFYNFESLNLSKDHPARNEHDSFYINSEMLLRTHTSPVQIRTMRKNKEKEPIRIICPGKVYRRDRDDATHSHQFMQIEGLVVGKGISMANLKGTLEVFVKHIFGENYEIRFRPSYFPFTEPSLEVDVTCLNCKGKGCYVCKDTGWIEILGSGMVHPNVLKMSGYDPEIYTGFAFGIGVDRIAMLKYGINDIREFYTNDVRFLDQFNRLEGGDINEG